MKKLFSQKVIKNKIVLSTASLLVLGTGTAYGTYEITKDTVSLTINGKEEKIRTHADTVNELLSEINIDIRAEDQISPEPSKKIKNNMKVVFEESIPVKVSIDDEQRTIWTTAKTVKELIESENITINEHDKIEPSLTTRLKEEMSLSIKKAFQLALNVGGEKHQVWTTSTTVADFLEKQNVKLNEFDKVDPALTYTIDEKSSITVTRVEKVTDVVEEPIAYDVIKKNDNSIAKGKQKIVDSGKQGKLEKHYEVVLENGKEVSRKLVKSVTVEESQDRVVAVGTKAVQPTTTVSRSNDSASKEFYVTSTAYTAHCNGCSGITATGINLKANPGAKVIAVDPRVIPLGTRVYVEGYGYAIAADTGSAIKGNKIDVFFPGKKQAYAWGRQTVLIKILN